MTPAFGAGCKRNAIMQAQPTWCGRFLAMVFAGTGGRSGRQDSWRLCVMLGSLGMACAVLCWKGIRSDDDGVAFGFQSR
jgi:hypothetical protein